MFDPFNFRTEGSFIHINSGKIFERDFLSSDSVAKSATQKPWVQGQSSKANICHAEARVENTHSGKMAHFSISTCDN